MKRIAVEKNWGRSGRAMWQTLAGVTVGFGLAAALIPHYLAAKQKTLAIAGFHNLQQWGIALNLHLADNAAQLPEIGEEVVDSSQKKAWYNSLPEYLGMPALADIPAGSRPRPGDSSIWFAPGSQPREDLSQEMFYFGYGMNKFLQTGISGRTARVTAMPHASQIVFLTQNESFVPWADPQEIPASTGLSNVLFCDGHVETISAAGTEK